MKYFLGLILIIGISLSFLLSTISIKDNSMLPDYQPDDRILMIQNPWLANQLTKLNDLAVFANPKEKDPPLNERSKLIRRVVAKSGDQIQIKNRSLLINGNPIEENNIAFTYRLRSSLNKTELVDQLNLYWIKPTVIEGMFDVLISPAQAKSLETNPLIQQIRLLDDPRALPDKPIYPFSERNTWTLINYGPFTIPGKGYTIELNEVNLQRFRMILINYEGVKLEEQAGKILINDTETRHYTFQKEYFFVLSDNRDYGEDSRTFGILPQEFLLGKIILSF